MKILILGAGKMGSFFTDLLSFEHEVAVLETIRSGCVSFITPFACKSRKK